MYYLPIEGEELEPQDSEKVIEAYEQILKHKDVQLQCLQTMLDIAREQLAEAQNQIGLFGKREVQNQRYFDSYEADLLAYENLYGKYQEVYIN